MWPPVCIVWDRARRCPVVLFQSGESIVSDAVQRHHDDPNDIPILVWSATLPYFCCCFANEGIIQIVRVDQEMTILAAQHEAVERSRTGKQQRATIHSATVTKAGPMVFTTSGMMIFVQWVASEPSAVFSLKHVLLEQSLANLPIVSFCEDSRIVTLINKLGILLWATLGRVPGVVYMHGIALPRLGNPVLTSIHPAGFIAVAYSNGEVVNAALAAGQAYASTAAAMGRDDHIRPAQCVFRLSPPAVGLHVSDIGSPTVLRWIPYGQSSIDHNPRVAAAVQHSAGPPSWSGLLVVGFARRGLLLVTPDGVVAASSLPPDGCDVPASRMFTIRAEGDEEHASIAWSEPAGFGVAGLCGPARLSVEHMQPPRSERTSGPQSSGQSIFLDLPVGVVLPPTARALVDQVCAAVAAEQGWLQWLWDADMSVHSEDGVQAVPSKAVLAKSCNMLMGEHHHNVPLVHCHLGRAPLHLRYQLPLHAMAESGYTRSPNTPLSPIDPLSTIHAADTLSRALQPAAHEPAEPPAGYSSPAATPLGARLMAAVRSGRELDSPAAVSPSTNAHSRYSGDNGVDDDEDGSASATREETAAHSGKWRPTLPQLSYCQTVARFISASLEAVDVQCYVKPEDRVVVPHQALESSSDPISASSVDSPSSATVSWLCMRCTARLPGMEGSSSPTAPHKNGSSVSSRRAAFSKRRQSSGEDMATVQFALAVKVTSASSRKSRIESAADDGDDVIECWGVQLRIAALGVITTPGALVRRLMLVLKPDRQQTSQSTHRAVGVVVVSGFDHRCSVGVLHAMRTISGGVCASNATVHTASVAAPPTPQPGRTKHASNGQLTIDTGAKEVQSLHASVLLSEGCRRCWLMEQPLMAAKSSRNMPATSLQPDQTDSVCWEATYIVGYSFHGTWLVSMVDVERALMQCRRLGQAIHDVPCYSYATLGGWAITDSFVLGWDAASVATDVRWESWGEEAGSLRPLNPATVQRGRSASVPGLGSDAAPTSLAGRSTPTVEIPTREPEPAAAGTMGLFPLDTSSMRRYILVMEFVSSSFVPEAAHHAGVAAQSNAATSSDTLFDGSIHSTQGDRRRRQSVHSATSMESMESYSSSRAALNPVIHNLQQRSSRPMMQLLVLHGCLQSNPCGPQRLLSELATHAFQAGVLGSGNGGEQSRPGAQSAHTTRRTQRFMRLCESVIQGAVSNEHDAMASRSTAGQAVVCMRCQASRAISQPISAAWVKLCTAQSPQAPTKTLYPRARAATPVTETQAGDGIAHLCLLCRTALVMDTAVPEQLVTDVIVAVGRKIEPEDRSLLFPVFGLPLERLQAALHGGSYRTALGFIPLVQEFAAAEAGIDATDVPHSGLITTIPAPIRPSNSGASRSAPHGSVITQLPAQLFDSFRGSSRSRSHTKGSATQAPPRIKRGVPVYVKLPEDPELAAALHGLALIFRALMQSIYRTHQAALRAMESSEIGSAPTPGEWSDEAAVVEELVQYAVEVVQFARRRLWPAAGAPPIPDMVLRRTPGCMQTAVNAAQSAVRPRRDSEASIASSHISGRMSAMGESVFSTAGSDADMAVPGRFHRRRRSKSPTAMTTPPRGRPPILRRQSTGDSLQPTQDGSETPVRSECSESSSAGALDSTSLADLIDFIRPCRRSTDPSIPLLSPPLLAHDDQDCEQLGSPVVVTDGETTFSSAKASVARSGTSSSTAAALWLGGAFEAMWTQMLIDLLAYDGPDRSPRHELLAALVQPTLAIPLMLDTCVVEGTRQNSESGLVLRVLQQLRACVTA